MPSNNIFDIVRRAKQNALIQLERKAKTQSSTGNPIFDAIRKAKELASILTLRRSLQGARVAPIGSFRKIQEVEFFHYPYSESTYVHSTTERYRLNNLVAHSGLAGKILPSGSCWVDTDKRLIIYDAHLHLRLTASQSFTAWVYLSATVDGSNPSDQEWARHDQKSIEEYLDDYFTTGEHDYQLFTQIAGSTIKGFDGTNPIYEIRQFIPIKDLMDKIQREYFTPDKENRSYSLWVVTYSRTAQTITVNKSFRVQGKIVLNRNTLL